MADFFQRKYELTFGLPITGITPDFFSPVKSSKEKLIHLENFVKSSGTTDYKLSSHNISFNIDMSTKTGTKNNWIEVNNLSDDLVNYLDSNSDKKIAVQLKAGYVGSIKLLFLGTLEKFSDDFSSSTRATRFSVGDGTINLKEARSRRSYPKGTPVDTIVEDMLGDLGVPKAEGGVVKLGDDIKCRAPYYVSGKTSDQIVLLSDDFGLDFTIIQNTAFVVPKNKHSTIFAPLISADTGLKGDITPAAEHKGKKAATTSKRRLEFTSFLNADIIPTGLVEIKHPRYSGTYKVISVKHSGGYERGDWDSFVTVEALE